MRAPILPTFLAALTITTVTPGCGGGGSGASIPLADYTREYVEAFCRRIYTCCDAAEIATDPDWGPTEADCVTAGIAFFSPSALQASVASGRVAYHGDRARKCVDNIAALSCADFGVGFLRQYIPDCAAIIEGKVPEGSSCTLVDECATGNCAGVCARAPGMGESCMGRCQQGLYCSNTTNTCTPIAPIGGACDENAGCENFFCALSGGTEPGVCSPQAMCNGA